MKTLYYKRWFKVGKMVKQVQGVYYPGEDVHEAILKLKERIKIEAINRPILKDRILLNIDTIFGEELSE